MNKKHYNQINEVLYKEILPNGLTVYLLPKEGFHKTYGLFSTDYGSIDNHFGYANETMHTVPDGIAHFLEHKLFEKEDGDVFQNLGNMEHQPMHLLASQKRVIFFRLPIKFEKI